MKTKTSTTLIGAVVFSLTTLTQADAGPIDGFWEAVLAGDTRVIALVGRTDGRLLGYTPSSPASWVVGGQRTGSSVTIHLDARDPMHSSDPGTITGTLSGSQITGTLTDSTGTTGITLQSVDAPRVVAHWLMGPSTAGNVLDRATRVQSDVGAFVAGGFVGLTDCSFLDCRGRITSWSVAGTAHAILTGSGGVCPSTSTLTGTWDAGTLLLNGTYTTTAACLPAPVGGSFFGGKEGGTSTGDVLDVLGLLRDFADRVEAESPAAADAFSDTYLHDGKTRADWQAQLAAMYAAYDDLRVTIDAVRQIVTFADAEVNPRAIPSPRLEWHLSVTGAPAGGGPAATVLDVTSTFDGEQQLYWIGREAGRIVFKGNGYAAPFSITVPARAGDSARTAYGIWPYGVHGGGHPEGHPGWDFEYVPGARVRAAADGVVDEITANSEFPGQVDVRVQHRPGYRTHYDHIGAIEPGVAVGVSVVEGQALGAAGDVGGFNMTHFGLDRNAASPCPLQYLDVPGLALFDLLWQTAAYEEELVEPFPCNAVAVTFPLTRVWTRVSGSLPAVIEFTRPDPHTTAYRYTLRNVSGDIVQSGAIVALRPSATLDSGTFDLQPDGAPTSTRFARYRILSNEMRVAWGPTRPVDLAAASLYSTTDPGFPPPLTALSPAKVRIGLKNSDDVGTKFDFLAEVLRNGVPVGSGETDNVSGGGSGFNNAVLRTIDLALSSNVAFSPGDTLSFRLKVRIAAASGHRSGTARLWFDDAAADAHFDATIGGVTRNYYLRNGFVLDTAPGVGPKKTIDVFVDRAVGGNPWKPFGTWSISF